MVDLSRLTPGLEGHAELVVGEQHTAPRIGSGRVHVLATPVMINLMEAAALDAAENLIPAGHQSLGTRLDVRHIAATPIGMRVRATARARCGRRPHADVRGRGARRAGPDRRRHPPAAGRQCRAVRSAGAGQASVERRTRSIMMASVRGSTEGTVRRRHFIKAFAPRAMAAVGARAATGDAGDRVHPHRVGRPNRYVSDAFRQGLQDAGIVEGRNAAIEYHWADGQYGRLPAIVDDLVLAAMSR